METNLNHPFFYVSAIDGGGQYLLAGPYSSHEAALQRVRAVKEYAINLDTKGRAVFMAWGTASSTVPIRSALGAHMGEYEEHLTDEERAAIEAANRAETRRKQRADAALRAKNAARKA